MYVHHLPTLDGSAEAAVARLEALDAIWRRDTIAEAVEDAKSAVSELREMAAHAGHCGDCDDVDCPGGGDSSVATGFSDAAHQNLDLIELLTDGVS